MFKVKNKHEKSKYTNTFLNVMIAVMIIINVFVLTINFPYYFNSNSSINNINEYNSQTKTNSSVYSPKIKPTNAEQIQSLNTNDTNHIKYINNVARHYSNAFNDVYTEKELEEAIKGLHLPTWSRGYLHCSHPKSEVTCPQIVHAYRILNVWAESQMKKGFSNHKHFIMQHLYDGVGNRMSTDTATFIIALMGNRTFTVEAFHPSSDPTKTFGQAFDFHPAVTYRRANNTIVNEYFDRHINTAFNIQTFDMWFHYDYDLINQKYDTLYVNYLLFAPMAYAHYQLGEFCYKHFGIHATYFICNFLMYIPDIAMKQAKIVVDSVPSNILLFGVHLRFHEPNHFFAKDVPTTINAVKNFLIDQYQKKPLIFALATDSPQIERSFKNIFPNNTISTNALRIPDADHLSALYDIALLEYCQKYLFTYRSTFSFIVAARRAKRGWFVDKESPDVFEISNSQSSIISMIYHQFDVNDWQVNRRFRLTDKGETIFRRYYLSFLL